MCVQVFAAGNKSQAQKRYKLMYNSTSLHVVTC